MNVKIIMLTMAAMLLASSFMVLPATPAVADNPILNFDSLGNVIIQPGSLPITTEPAAPPPPPAAPTTPAVTPPPAPAVTTPPITGTVSLPPPPLPPSDNTTLPPPGPRPPRPYPPAPPRPYDYYNNWAYSYPYYYQYYMSYYYRNSGYPYYYYPGGTVQQVQTVYYAPAVNSFTADPSYIQPGQIVTLSWNVSNADLISISPSVGSVAASGSFAVVPEYTTTYTLTATSSQGSASATTTVTVAPYTASYYNTYEAGSSAPAGTTWSLDSTSTGTPGSIDSYATGAASTADPVTTSGVSSSSTPAVNLWLMYLLLIGLLAVAAAVIIALLVRKPATARTVSHSTTGAGYAATSTASAFTAQATSSPVTTQVEASLPAKFVSPGGTTMPVTGNPLGRKDLQALVAPEKADTISRQHILVTYENSQYFIEDLNSTNGTKLNGSEIRGTSKHEITNGDTVELAGVLTLTFKV